MLPASTVQMLAGTSIVYSALLTVCYLKRRLCRHHVLAIVMIIGGIAIVGWAVYLDNRGKEMKHTFEDQLFGVCLLQLGILSGAIGFIIEEKFI